MAERQGTETEDSPPLAEATPDSQRVTSVRLPSGEALSEADAAEVTIAALTRIVVLAGPAASGKTTAIVSLYESLRKGSMPEHQFAGSRSLLGFERRCHLARIDSEATEADTDRTNPSEGTRFLHLRLVRVNRAIDVLITDLSGELFRQAQNSTEDARRLTVVRRADHLVFMVDGAKVSEEEERHQAFADTQLIARSLAHADMIDPRSKLHLVFAKWDKILASNPGETLGLIARFKADFANEFQTQGAGLDFHELAARPEGSSDLPIAYGLSELVSEWLAVDVTAQREASFDIDPHAREFVRFGLARSALV